MIIREIDAGGDWKFGKGKNNYKTGNPAVAEAIQTRLLSFLGDCFFSITDGIDWLTFLSSKNQLGLIAAVSAAILNTQDASGQPLVTGIQQLSVTLDHASRKISIQYKAQTIYSLTGGTFQYDIGGA